MRIRSYDIMSASEPESCLQIYGERRMAITIAASAAVSIEDANRGFVSGRVRNIIRALSKDNGVMKSRN